MAWTVVETLHDSKQVRDLTHINCIKLVMTGDGNASNHDLGATLKDYWQGSVLYGIKIVPGTGGDAPTGTFDLDIEDDTDFHILDTDANPNNATTYVIGSDTIGAMPPVLTTLSVVCADIGAANIVTVYLYFWK